MAQQLALEQAPILARFMKKVREDPETGCWEWLGAPRGDGYGQVCIDGYHWGAHRLSYSLFVGPIPGSLVIDHLCLNPLCVNPEHMEIVTKRVNTLRGNGITAQEARRAHCPRGHPYDKANTYLNKGSRHCRTCIRNRDRSSLRRGLIAAPSCGSRPHPDSSPKARLVSWSGAAPGR